MGTQIYTSKGAKIPDGIKNILSSENWGQFGESIKNNIAGIIEELVGKSSGSYQKQMEYRVTVGSLGALIRIDYQIVCMGT